MFDYQKQATDFLESASITFTAVLIGSDCPKFCKDAEDGKDMDKVDSYPRKSHIHGKHYRCTFTRRTKVSEANGKPIYDDKRDAPKLVIDFWNSYADEEYNNLIKNPFALDAPKYDALKKERNTRKAKHLPALKTPTPYDVLACLQKDEVGTFEQFCGDFGYDDDSRKAYATYEAVQDEWSRVSRFFTKAELEQLREFD